MAIGVHLALARVGVLEPQEKVAKPLTTRFVKRQPRLSKPLELKKRPQPKRRLVRRTVVAVTARVRSESKANGVHPVDLVTRLARPGTSPARTVPLSEAYLDAQVLSEAVTGSREPADRMAMGLEMLDVEALDTGQYHAMVIQDPTDKRNIQGFLHLCLVTPVRSGFDPNVHIRHIRRLAELGMNRFTDIRTDVWAPLALDSSEIFKVPWLFTEDLGAHFELSTPEMDLTHNERENLGVYLMRGGFVHADAVPPGKSEPYVPAVRLRKLLADALSTQRREYRRDWSFDRLPPSHALYHCYFDFEGPPAGYAAGNPDFQDVPFLEGMTIEHRLLAIISQMHYSHVWGNWGAGGNSTGGSFDPTRNLQFGVNIIVFALTQEGSITRQLMDAIQ